MAATGRRLPDASFIMPCYNEKDVIPYAIPQFVQAFERAAHRLNRLRSWLSHRPGTRVRR